MVDVVLRGTPMDLDAPAADQLAGKSKNEVSRRIDELQNSISHLVRSNKELEEFMAENGFDKELRVAIGENCVVIARRRAILEDLEKEVSAGVSLTPPSAASATKQLAEVTMAEADPVDADGGVYL